MTKIATFFNCNLYHKISTSDAFKEPVKMVVFYVQSDKSPTLVTNYFNKYPLMSSKGLKYLCYVQACNFLGKRLTEEEILEARSIKGSMNRKRTDFN